MDKVQDVVGLYMSAPNRAIVLCLDEKSQIQALDREQPVLLMAPGVAERRTHTYLRNGTTLFAALNVTTGAVVGKYYKRHRATEFLDFLKELDRNLPTDLDIHIVMDNYSTHKTKIIRDWFAKRPRWHVHFIPTSASWINQVERFFVLLTDRALRRGVFRSVSELEDTIQTYIDQTNVDPKPFRWTKTADNIPKSINCFCLRTLSDQDSIRRTSDSGHYDAPFLYFTHLIAPHVRFETACASKR